MLPSDPTARCQADSPNGGTRRAVNESYLGRLELPGKSALMQWGRRGSDAGAMTGFWIWTSRASWIVFHTAPWLLKKLWLLIDHLDSQAFMPALPHQNSF